MSIKSDLALSLARKRWRAAEVLGPDDKPSWDYIKAIALVEADRRRADYYERIRRSNDELYANNPGLRKLDNDLWGPRRF